VLDIKLIYVIYETLMMKIGFNYLHITTTKVTYFSLSRVIVSPSIRALRMVFDTSVNLIFAKLNRSIDFVSFNISTLGQV
jgi:hypothetical protein